MNAFLLAFALCADPTLHLAWEGGDPTESETQDAADSGGTMPRAKPESVLPPLPEGATWNWSRVRTDEPRRHTRQELVKLAYDYANRQRQLQATVNPPNQVWNHLKNEHGFTAEQVDGLTFNQALWVHSGAHTGVITPMTGANKAVLPVIAPRYEMRRFCGPGGCFWQRVRVN
jgi:hypothetical protein